MPPHVADVGVDDVGCAALEHLAELEARVELLAGHDRHADLAAALGQRADVARRHRLLEPERIERLEHARDPHRVHGRQPAMHLDQEIDLGADRLAHGAHVLHRLLLDLA